MLEVGIVLGHVWRRIPIRLCMMRVMGLVDLIIDINMC